MENFSGVLSRLTVGAIALVAVAQAAAQTAPISGVSPAAAGANGAPMYGAPTATSFTSKIGFITMDRDPGASYPRVIQLKIGANKGTLLASYSHRGNLPIYRSTDNGDSWTLFS